jgi:hypothetical protein
MTLIGPWTPTLIDRLNTIADEIWARWYYDIQLDPFDNESPCGDLTSTFCGNGRWAFCRNMDALGSWMDAEIKEKPQYASICGEFLRGMQENGLTIKVSYSDEESGCLVLYRQTGVLSSDGKKLAYGVTSEENFVYNWDNYIDVTRDTEDLDLLVASLCEHLGIENDDSSGIERWARIHTYPHCTEYEYLGKETQSEFNKAFLNTPVSPSGGDESV